MNVVVFLLLLAVFGFFVWLILKIEMPAVLQSVILGIAVVVCIVAALQFMGVNTGPIPHLNLWPK